MKLSLLLCLFVFASCSSIQKIKEIKNPFDKIERKLPSFMVKWSKNLDPSYSSGNLPIGTGSPFIHEGILYMGDLEGNFNAYDLETGTLLWSTKDDDSINSQAVVFADSIVYGTMSGRLYSRHYLTGKLNYAIDLGSSIESAPVVTGGRMYVHLRNHKLVALDATTGKVFWGYRRSVPFTTTLQRVSKVLPFKNKLIIGFADGNIVALSREEGVEIWAQKISSGVKFIDVDATPIYFNGFIVAGSANDKLRFINPDNGLIVKTIEVVAAHAPLHFRDQLIVGTVYGEIARIDKNGKLIYKKKISNKGISSVAPWKEGFAVATMDGKIHYIQGMNFEKMDTFDLGYDQSAVFGYLEYSGDYLAVYSSRNRLYVFKDVK